jgi:hypothetical protein
MTYSSCPVTNDTFEEMNSPSNLPGLDDISNKSSLQTERFTQFRQSTSAPWGEKKMKECHSPHFCMGCVTSVESFFLDVSVMGVVKNRSY